MHVTWPHPHSTATELEINSAHSDFHTRTGGDEKLKKLLRMALQSGFISIMKQRKMYIIFGHKRPWTRIFQASSLGQVVRDMWTCQAVDSPLVSSSWGGWPEVLVFGPASNDTPLEEEVRNSRKDSNRSSPEESQASGRWRWDQSPLKSCPVVALRLAEELEINEGWEFGEQGGKFLITASDRHWKTVVEWGPALCWLLSESRVTLKSPSSPAQMIIFIYVTVYA